MFSSSSISVDSIGSSLYSFRDPFTDPMAKIGGILTLCESSCLHIHQDLSRPDQQALKQDVISYSEQLQTQVKNFSALVQQGYKPADFYQWILARNTFISKCDILTKQLQDWAEFSKNWASQHPLPGGQREQWTFSCLLEALQTLRTELWLSVNTLYDPNGRGASYGNPYMIAEAMRQYPTS